MSDKANVTITSTLDGLVHELHYKVGEMANVGKLLVTFKSGAGGASSAPSLSEETAKRQPLPPLLLHLHPNPFDDKIKTTPAVWGMARENNIDLSTVQPTGPRNILKIHMKIRDNYNRKRSSFRVTRGPWQPRLLIKI